MCHPDWDCVILSLCRASDADRAPKFHEAIRMLGATGDMGDLDDGDRQEPLADSVVHGEILRLLPDEHYDLVITHHPVGEYTRHLRHEEVGRAVLAMFHSGQIKAECLWCFAYEDGNGRYLPRPVKAAPIQQVLPARIWKKKHLIITDCYGFAVGSFEAAISPESESFWQYAHPAEVVQVLAQGEAI
jgi:LmbE family N-acetylglucosaminyl deacetylase